MLVCLVVTVACWIQLVLVCLAVSTLSVTRACSKENLKCINLLILLSICACFGCKDERSFYSYEWQWKALVFGEKYNISKTH